MRRAVVAKALIVLGAVGIVTSLVGAAVGVRTVMVLDDLVAEDGVLSADVVTTLEGSVDLAEDTAVTLEDSLAQIEATTRDLASAFSDGEDLLAATAELSEQEIAPGVAAVQDALPALIEAATVIDTALVALSAVPFGPEYEPPEPFDASLRRVERELDGLPDDLEQQAALIRETGERLGDVRRGTATVADDLAALRDRLRTAAEMLDGYAEAAGDATEVVAEGREALGRQLLAARVLVVVLGLVLAAGQAVPIGAGWFLLRPERLAALLEQD